MPRLFERLDDPLGKGMTQMLLGMPVEVPPGLLREVTA
jgi:hypothetical protein